MSLSRRVPGGPSVWIPFLIPHPVSGSDFPRLCLKEVLTRSHAAQLPTAIHFTHRFLFMLFSLRCCSVQPLLNLIAWWLNSRCVCSSPHSVRGSSLFWWPLPKVSSSSALFCKCIALIHFLSTDQPRLRLPLVDSLPESHCLPVFPQLWYVFLNNAIPYKSSYL